MDIITYSKALNGRKPFLGREMPFASLLSFLSRKILQQRKNEIVTNISSLSSPNRLEVLNYRKDSSAESRINSRGVRIKRD